LGKRGKGVPKEEKEKYDAGKRERAKGRKKRNLRGGHWEKKKKKGGNLGEGIKSSKGKQLPGGGNTQLMASPEREPDFSGKGGEKGPVTNFGA